jgi:prepilin-type N-terminal cleavage/methylation domain-containing protein
VVLYRQNKSFGGQIHLRNKIVFSKQTNILIAPQFAHRKQGGFTIIEVLVTLLIIGVTLLLYTVISNSITLNKYNRYKEVALRSAETRLQDLRTVSYDSLPTSGTFTNAQIQTLPEGTANLEITEISTGLSEATVTVSWRSPSSNTMQEISLSTFLSEHGIGK